MDKVISPYPNPAIILLALSIASLFLLSGCTEPSNAIAVSRNYFTLPDGNSLKEVLKLNDLNDVSTTGETNGQVLGFNGFVWVPTDLPDQTVDTNWQTSWPLLDANLKATYPIKSDVNSWGDSRYYPRTSNPAGYLTSYTDTNWETSWGTFDANMRAQFRNYSVNYLDFNLNDCSTNSEGRLCWDYNSGTLQVGMPGGNVNLQIGQEELIRSRNTSGVDINNGNIVYITGHTDGQPNIALADADNSSAHDVIGVATEDIANNHWGYVTSFGLVHDLDTSSYSPGQELFLSQTPGRFTGVIPTAPAHTVRIGYVIKDHAVTGDVFVRVKTGFDLNMLDDVNTLGKVDGSVLFWDAASGTWQAKIISVPSGNPFDQNLNTFDSVRFVDVNATGSVTGHRLVVGANSFEGTETVRVVSTDDAAPTIRASGSDGLTPLDIYANASGFTQWLSQLPMVIGAYTGLNVILQPENTGQLQIGTSTPFNDDLNAKVEIYSPGTGLNVWANNSWFKGSGATQFNCVGSVTSTCYDLFGDNSAACAANDYHLGNCSWIDNSSSGACDTSNNYCYGDNGYCSDGTCSDSGSCTTTPGCGSSWNSEAYCSDNSCSTEFSCTLQSGGCDSTWHNEPYDCADVTCQGDQTACERITGCDSTWNSEGDCYSTDEENYGSCSDSQYTNKTDCENNSETWTPYDCTVYVSQGSCESYYPPCAWNDTSYCTDNSPGCNDSQARCENPEYGSDACESSWIDGSYCTDGSCSNEADCERQSGGCSSTWNLGGCSDPNCLDEPSCIAPTYGSSACGSTWNDSTCGSQTSQNDCEGVSCTWEPCTETDQSSCEGAGCSWLEDPSYCSGYDESTDLSSTPCENRPTGDPYDDCSNIPTCSISEDPVPQTVNIDSYLNVNPSMGTMNLLHNTVMGASKFWSAGSLYPAIWGVNPAWAANFEGALTFDRTAGQSNGFIIDSDRINNNGDYYMSNNGATTLTFDNAGEISTPSNVTLTSGTLTAPKGIFQGSPGFSGADTPLLVNGGSGNPLLGIYNQSGIAGQEITTLGLTSWYPTPVSGASNQGSYVGFYQANSARSFLMGGEINSTNAGGFFTLRVKQKSGSAFIDPLIAQDTGVQFGQEYNTLPTTVRAPVEVLNRTYTTSPNVLIEKHNGQNTNLMDFNTSGGASLARVDANGKFYSGTNQLCDASNNCGFATRDTNIYTAGILSTDKNSFKIDLNMANNNIYKAGDINGNRLNLDSNAFINGKVVIGTGAGGNYALDVTTGANGVNIASGMAYRTNSIWGIGTVGTVTYVGGSSTGLSLGANGNNQMYINNGGNIGVNTVTPSYALDVNGALGVSGNIQGTASTSLYMGSKARISADSSGDFSINYNNGATKSLSVYGGDTVKDWGIDINGNTSQTGNFTLTNIVGTDANALVSANNSGTQSSTRSASLVLDASLGGSGYDYLSKIVGSSSNAGNGNSIISAYTGNRITGYNTIPAWTCDSNNKCGINLAVPTSTAPTAQLDVNGTARVRSDLNLNGNAYINGNLVLDGNMSIKRPYGVWDSTKIQTVSSTTAAYVMDFNNTEDDYLIYRTTDNNFVPSVSGDYLMEISIMALGNQGDTIDIWFQKNGVNVPRSNTKYTFKANSSVTVISVPFIIDLLPTDNVRVMYHGSNTAVQLPYYAGASNPAVPETPSTILTMTKVSEITP